TEIARGKVQAAQAPASSAHWKRLPLSVAANENVAVVPFVATEVSRVSGGVASTVQLAVAGVASALPAGSTARTASVCLPSASAEYDAGDEQAASAPPSRAHSKREPGSVA